MPVILSTHHRTRKMMDSKAIEFNPVVSFIKFLGFNDYIKLESKAKATLSDSGNIIKESSILGFRTLNIRQSHEGLKALWNKHQL